MRRLLWWLNPMVWWWRWQAWWDAGNEDAYWPHEGVVPFNRDGLTDEDLWEAEMRNREV